MYTKDQIDLAIKELGLAGLPDTLDELHNHIKAQLSSEGDKNLSNGYSAVIDESAFILKQELTVNENWFNSADSFYAFKAQLKEKYEIAKEDGTVNTLEGPVRYKAGFYILTGPKGEKYPISPEKFNDLKDDLGDESVSLKK